jgi:hypothetical protein
LAEDFATSLPRWRDPAWLHAARAWVAEALAGIGATATGDAQQVRARPWSTQLTVPTDAGTFWFKANAIGVVHEAALMEVLARRCPEHVLTPVAVDAGRGWLLLPDGGRTLRDVGGGTDLTTWERLLVGYAELQRTLVPYVGELLAAGTPDRRPSRLPALRDSLLADQALVMLGQPDGLTEEQHAALVTGSSAYAGMCVDLDAFGVPTSLQHDDLHDNNVFAPLESGGALRIFDWGDSVVGHPFGTLLVSLRMVADLTGLAYGSPELLRLRDAYLEPWTGEHDRPDLVEACRLALRVGGVLRADCYRRALLEATPAGRQEYGDGVPQWLLEGDRPIPVEPAGPSADQ